MSRQSRSQRAVRKTQSPLLIPAIIVGAGFLFFAVGSVLSSRARPGAANEPALAGTKQFAAAPPMLIDPAKTYTATLRTVRGDVVIQLLPDKAPITVNSFVFLARHGYFDGVTFHRVLPGFMAQGGDPTGTGTGGPGYQFANENNDLKFDAAGIVAMANAGRDTNGSQFFITYAPKPSLDGGYTIFGRVIEGMDVVESLTPRNPDENPATPGDAIVSVTIEEQ